MASFLSVCAVQRFDREINVKNRVIKQSRRRIDNNKYTQDRRRLRQFHRFIPVEQYYLVILSEKFESRLTFAYSALCEQSLAIFSMKNHDNQATRYVRHYDNNYNHDYFFDAVGTWGGTQTGICPRPVCFIALLPSYEIVEINKQKHQARPPLGGTCAKGAPI